MELYRKEAIASFLQSEAGKVLHIGKLPYRNFSLFIVAFLICLFAFLRWGHYSQTEVVTGVLIPSDGYTRIFSGSGGVVDTFHVAEGDRVKKGEVLLNLRSAHSIGSYSDFNEGRIEQITQLINFQKQRITEQNQLFSNELQTIQTDIQNIQEQIALSTEQQAHQSEDVQLLQRQLSSQQKLLDSNHTSQVTLDEKQRQLLSSTMQLSAINKDIAQLQARLESQQQQLQHLPNQHQIRQLETQQHLANLEMQLIEANAQLGQQIKASVDGIVSNIVYEPGNFIPATKPIMTILPDSGQLYAELYVPTRARGFLVLGQQVLLRFHAYPYQKFGAYSATIDEISATVMVAETLPIQLVFNEPVYRVRALLDTQFIRAYGDQVPLQTGMLLDAEIIRDRRTLFEWLFEPILSMSKRP